MQFQMPGASIRLPGTWNQVPGMPFTLPLPQTPTPTQQGSVTASPIGSARQRLVLKGVNISEVLEEFRRGDYIRMSIPMGRPNLPINNVVSVISQLSNKPEVGGSQFIVSLPSYGKLTYQTTNTEAYQAFTTDGTRVKGGCCGWCRRDFTWDRFGIPVYMEEYSGELPAGLTIPSDRKVLLVHYENTNCTYECALAEMSFRKKAGMCPNSNYYSDSGSILATLFSISYPGSQLEPAGDWRELQRFGGWKTEEEFHSKTHRYVMISDLHLVPAKLIFQQVLRSQ